MNGLLLSGFPHGIDVAEHLVDGFNAVLHTLFAFVANAFAQLDYFLVLTHLLAKVLNLSIGLLLLQAVVEEEGFPIGGDLLAFDGNQLLVILSGVKRTDVPADRCTYSVLSIPAIPQHIHPRITNASLQKGSDLGHQRGIKGFQTGIQQTVL